MGTFTGTTTEFRRHIGPRLRNFVNLITRQHKAKVAKCEHCGCPEKGELEAAHVAGRDRNQIIELILKSFIKNGIVNVDISNFEELFKRKHFPLEKNILILCRSCHKKYDTRFKVTSRLPQEVPAIQGSKSKADARITRGTDTALVRLVRSIGQSVFVRYYREFADSNLSNQAVAKLLPSEYTAKSRNSRTGHARKIFRAGLQIEALELICKSKRGDPESAANARELLGLHRKQER